MARKYLNPGDTIGCTGYTDLKITKGNGTINGLDLASTEGGELQYYDEGSDTHFSAYIDFDGDKESNPNYGRYYYEDEKV